MKGLLLMSLFLLGLGACDYKEYPQEEEWKEEFMEKQEEENGDRELNFSPGNS